ncbi:MAG: hypothetical protein IKW28_00590 [Lachnospiraceae bacterium]|nr:hypothetical protein [Lachnospiraceae bacterium]
MVAIQIKEIKTFMTKLLSSSLFDFFLVKEAQINTYNNFYIEGHTNRDFFTKEELEDPATILHEYSLWQAIKPILFQIIKGKKVPSLLKITLLLPPEKLSLLSSSFEKQELSSFLKYFVLTIKYDSQGLTLTTGTAFTTFVADKTADTVWDHEFPKFLSENAIDYDL